MSLVFTDDQSTLVRVIAWCCQATSHYLSHCWPRSLSPHENHLSYIPSESDRGQWLNLIFLSGTNELFRYINVLCSFRQFLPVTRNLSKPLGPSISCKWSDCMHADYIKRFLLPNIIWWFYYQYVSQQLYKLSSLVSYDRYFYAQNDIPGAIPDATRYAFQCINHISMYRVLITNTVSRLAYYQ